MDFTYNEKMNWNARSFVRLTPLTNKLLCLLYCIMKDCLKGFYKRKQSIDKIVSYLECKMKDKFYKQ